MGRTLGARDQAATIRPEHLWQNLCEAEVLPPFCAYPKAGFIENVEESISEICAPTPK
jgi:hypothetical protein